jgi:hypothetical protein
MIQSTTQRRAAVSGYRCRIRWRHACTGPRGQSHGRLAGTWATALPPPAGPSQRTGLGAAGRGTGRRRRCAPVQRCADQRAGTRAHGPLPLAARTSDRAERSRPGRWGLRRHARGFLRPNRRLAPLPRRRQTPRRSRARPTQIQAYASPSRAQHDAWSAPQSPTRSEGGGRGGTMGLRILRVRTWRRVAGVGCRLGGG